MTIWRFSDGTTAALGGTVEGASLFAQALRAALADEPVVSFLPPPSESVPLDPHDLLHFDTWLTAQAAMPFWRSQGIKITARPKDIPELPEPEEDEQLEEDTVY